MRASFFEYDHAGRCMASRERSFSVSNGIVTYGADRSSYQYQYDACNNLTRLVTSVGTNKWNTTYTYDADNRPKTTTLSTGKTITTAYNAYNLVYTKTIGLNTDYVIKILYVNDGNGRYTPQVRWYKNGNEYALKYEYDDNGNLVKISRSDGANPITYTYDSANRLTRENNSVTNQTVTYTYDTWGNITSKKTYAYTTGTPGTATSTLTYTYGNSAWCDQLTKLNGTAITYDENGNPLSYRGWTFSWRGKQLISATKDSNTLTFAYDENGLRHKKVYNGVTTNYYYNGSVLIGMERSGTNYLFSYDASGNVVSVKYNGSEYYYLRNGQGDIVKLIDASGATVVQYIYDTWGKKISTTGSMASTLGLIQPFRYRGYVYDFEWGYYYLESRYYDPVTCRFISSDVYLSTGQGVLGHNSYAYCLDNPVNMTDPNGTSGIVTRTWAETLTGREVPVTGFERKPDRYYLQDQFRRGDPSEYISSQDNSSIAGLRFGLWGTIGNNGCGYVAVYNALTAAGYNISFEEMVHRYNSDLSNTLLGGSLGMSPLALDRILRCNFGTKNVDLLSLSGNYDCIVVCYLYWSKTSNSPGGHYFFAENDGKGNYTVYNDQMFTSSVSLREIANAISTEGNRPLMIWGISY